jgi:hypothetical protein
MRGPWNACSGGERGEEKNGKIREEKKREGKER